MSIDRMKVPFCRIVCRWKTENASFKHINIEKTKLYVKTKDASINEILVTPKTTIVQKISIK